MDPRYREILHFRACEFLAPEIPFKIYRLTDEAAANPWHDHDYHQIWYVRSGSCRHETDDASVILSTGDLFFVPAGAAHRIVVEPGVPVEIIGCEFANELLRPVIADLQIAQSDEHEANPGKAPQVKTHAAPPAGAEDWFGDAYSTALLQGHDRLQPQVRLQGYGAELVENLLLGMLHDFKAEMPFYQVSIRADMTRLLLLVARLSQTARADTESSTDARRRQAIAAVLDHIRKHFAKPISVSQAAAIAGMSRSNFSAAFKQMVGRTFVEELNHVRIQHALTLLDAPNLTIAEICYQSGFRDPAYFDRVFKRKTGRSPNEFRNRRQDNA